MGKSTKAQLQMQMLGVLLPELSARGYLYEMVEDECRFRKALPSVEWGHTFRLSGEALFYVFSNTYLSYLELEDQIRALVPSMSDDLERFGRFGPGESVTNFWPETSPKQLRSGQEANDVALGFLAATERIENQFLRPYCDPTLAVEESCRFYTKWPRGMSPMSTSLLLISWGLLNKREDLVKLGAERIEGKLSYCQTERHRSFMDAVRSAALENIAA